MNKRKRIEQEIDTIGIYRIECGHCGEVWETEGQTLDDFISDIEPEFHIAISDDYGSMGLICDSCFSDEDSDWKEYKK